MKGVRLSQVFAVGLLLWPLTVFGQVRDLKERVLGSSGTAALEIKPLPTVLIMVPGVSSIGIGAEVAAGQDVALFANAFAVNANLPGSLRNEDREDKTPILQKMDGYAADIGGRYYARGAHLDSWYSGAKVGYAFGIGQWGYKDEQVDHVVRTITPGAEGGYRWVWPSNLLVRLAAGLDGNVVQENVATPSGLETATTEDAEGTIEGYAKVALLPRVDLGIGYMF